MLLTTELDKLAATDWQPFFAAERPFLYRTRDKRPLARKIRICYSTIAERSRIRAAGAAIRMRRLRAGRIPLPVRLPFGKHSPKKGIFLPHWLALSNAN